HDALDAIRAGVLTAEALPPAVIERFGQPGRGWIGHMIDAVVDNSLRVGRVEMDEATLAVMHDLRDFMFDRVYQSAQQRGQQLDAVRVLRDLVDWHVAHPDEIPDSYRQDAAPLIVQVTDYVAGMTDRYALRLHEDRIGPASTA
ncbi:MAG TPA: deoxyguanosinetriphosphate triphosphohydrolase, partial [Candidatus Limnocylindria bacterium]|nr:deoxyguanosinetriphosphate triphosphohydrolase [Candidatus Limnocylindria bacterium]